MIVDTFKRAIRTGGKSRYRLWKETGVSQAALSRLMSGERGLTIDAAERLAPALGLVISIKPRTPKASKPRTRKGTR